MATVSTGKSMVMNALEEKLKNYPSNFREYVVKNPRLYRKITTEAFNDEYWKEQLEKYEDEIFWHRLNDITALCQNFVKMHFYGSPFKVEIMESIIQRKLHNPAWLEKHRHKVLDPINYEDSYWNIMTRNAGRDYFTQNVASNVHISIDDFVNSFSSEEDIYDFDEYMEVVKDFATDDFEREMIDILIKGRGEEYKADIGEQSEIIKFLMKELNKKFNTDYKIGTIRSRYYNLQHKVARKMGLPATKYRKVIRPTRTCQTAS